MEIVGKVAATIQNVLGPEAEELGRATGVITPARKFRILAHTNPTRQRGL